ncbi:MAG: 4Fe-4S binding protein [Patescibacteria group bacterium]
MKINPGGKITEPGNSKQKNTGKWREGKRPEFDSDKCAQCLRCAAFCPEEAIVVKNGKVDHIDYTKCKGCGICVEECPVKAITMVEE